MKPVLALVLAAAAMPALAAQPSAIPAQNGMRSFPGVSNSGNAIINEGSRPDTQLDALSRQARSLHDQLNAAIAGPSIDVERVAGLLRQSDSLQAQGRQHVTERIVGTLRQLSAADRAAFLRDILNPQQQQGMPPR